MMAQNGHYYSYNIVSSILILQLYFMANAMDSIDRAYPKSYQDLQDLQLQFQHYQLQQQKLPVISNEYVKPPIESIQEQFEKIKHIQLIYYQKVNAETNVEVYKKNPNTENLYKKTEPPEISSLHDFVNSSSCVDPPFVCPHPRIQFFLYTRETQTNPQLLDTRDKYSLYYSKFNPNHSTKIIIHGFQGGRDQSPSTDLRDAYFNLGEYNIIIVDYSSLAQIPCVSQVEWSPRFCGKCIAQLIHYLNNHPGGVRLDKLHLIGYSIGAHIAGLSANYVKLGKLGRITGLDPTIVFNMGLTRNRSKDLDYTDAHFVDIIHTAAGVLGQWGPSGHADFYVNGGTSQPGCISSTLIATLSCDHTRATPYFIESINSETGFWAVQCPNRFFYSLGWCNPSPSELVLMGEHVSHEARGTYYVTTGSKKPYARGNPYT